MPLAARLDPLSALASVAATLAALPKWEVYIQDQLATELGFDIEVKLKAEPS